MVTANIRLSHFLTCSVLVLSCFRVNSSKGRKATLGEHRLCSLRWRSFLYKRIWIRMEGRTFVHEPKTKRNNFHSIRNPQTFQIGIEMAKEEHLVERLFSPNITAREFFSHSRQFGSLTFEKKAQKRAKRVEEIYNITNKKFHEERMMKIKTCISKQTVRECEPTLFQKDAAFTEVTKTAEDTSLYLGESYLLSGIEEHVDSSIRQPKEPASFRQKIVQHFEGESQKKELLTLNAEIAELKAKLKKTEEELQNVQTELLESKRKATCYAINLEQIEKNSKKDLIIQSLQEELQDKSKTVSRLNMELYNSRTEIQDLRLQNKNIQQQLNELKQQDKLRNMTCIELVKLQYDSHLNKLCSELQAVKEEIGSAKLQRDRNLSAYELLRKHLS